MKHKIELDLEDRVYLRTDDDQKERIVTGIELRPFDAVTYGLTLGTEETFHWMFEISKVKDKLKSLGVEE